MIISPQAYPLWAVLAYYRSGMEAGYTADRVLAWAVDPDAPGETGPRPVTFDSGVCGSASESVAADRPMCVSVHDSETAAEKAAEVAAGARTGGARF